MVDLNVNTYAHSVKHVLIYDPRDTCNVGEFPRVFPSQRSIWCIPNLQYVISSTDIN